MYGEGINISDNSSYERILKEIFKFLLTKNSNTFKNLNAIKRGILGASHPNGKMFSFGLFF